jgi:hypothetical protein
VKNKKFHAVTKRVYLGKKTDANTAPWPMIYPCMMDTEWYKDFLGGHEDEKVVAKSQNPDGWMVDGNAEDADD